METHLPRIEDSCEPNGLAPRMAGQSQVRRLAKIQLNARPILIITAHLNGKPNDLNGISVKK
jgi:hypothetical protein